MLYIKKYWLTVLVVLLLIVVTVQGYFLYLDQYQENSSQQIEISHNDEFYTCPMHPTVRSDKPGSCRVCGMKLVKKTIKNIPPKSSKNTVKKHSLDRSKQHIQTQSKAKINAQDIEMVSLSPLEIIKGNVKTIVSQVSKVHKEIRAFGVVTYDTNKMSQVPTWVGGRLDKLYVKAIGDQIKQNDLLAEIYSPELIATQREYLEAKRVLQDIHKSHYNSILKSYENTVEAVKQKLKYLGLTENQINTVTSEPDIHQNIPIYSKYTGTVVELNAFEGQYVQQGDTLYKIADFSSVWIEAEIEESDVSYAKPGQLVKIFLESYPNKPFSGAISYVYPFLQEETRTLKVRITLPNYGKVFKPNMFADVRISVPQQEKLLIPRSAILYTGQTTYVWVESEPNMYHKRIVQIGSEYGESYEVLEGITQGEKIVSSGGFLIDSEAQLKSGASGGGHQH